MSYCTLCGGEHRFHHPDCPVITEARMSRAAAPAPEPRREMLIADGNRLVYQPPDANASLPCDHDLTERETACADGMCPLCLARELAAARAEGQRILTMMQAERAELARARQIVAELVAAGDAVIESVDVEADGTSERNWKAWQAARAFLAGKA